ncbi:MAG: CHAT domain-containing protein [Anaerolineae bacterium]
MDYLSFDLRLGEWNPVSRTGVAEVLQSPVGEGERYAFILDLDVSACAKRSFRTRTSAASLGRRLAEGVLSRQSLTLWHESYQVARERHRGLRLRLHIDSWELCRLPWELMYDPHRGDFLVFDPMVSLVRYMRLHAAPPTLRQGKSLKVMAVVASPKDQALLDWRRELNMLEGALKDLKESGQIQVLTCEHATHEKLHLALLENTPDVVHFIGHGEYDEQQHVGILLLEDGQGAGAPLAAPEAARMLRRYGVNLVVLNACDTASGTWAGLGPSLVRAEIPGVVAMQWPVEDHAAICFTRLFYKALSLGRTVDECMSEGRIGLSTTSADPNDWAAPVLFLRSLSGRLWTSDVTKQRDELLVDDGVTRAAEIQRPPTAAALAEGEMLFKTRGPLLPGTEAEVAVDRPELRRALRIVHQASVTQYLAFLSARQTGKTTLLFRLMELMEDWCRGILIDLSVLRAQDVKACYRFVAFRLVSEFRSLLQQDGATFPETPQVDNAAEFLAFLHQLAEAVPVKRVVVLLDEVGALAPEVSDSFFNALRGVFTQGRGRKSALAKYLFVFSGAVDLHTLTFGTNSPLNICEKIYLRDFEQADVQRMVKQFSRLSVEVPAKAAKQIYELTGGHPYLTMRLCALLEQAGAQVLTPEAIERAAEEILVEDDNIRHVIHELERHPLERRKLYSIVVEGRQVPFSRNDPVLASLEMIGAVRAAQPCIVRNRLYERALRDYYGQSTQDAPGAVAVVPTEPDAVEDRDAAYRRLRGLHEEAKGSAPAAAPDTRWETFAAALFSLVPAFSVYPDLTTSKGHLGIVLGIDDAARGGDVWGAFRPAILVERADGQRDDPERLVSAVAAKAAAHNMRLVLVVVSGTVRKPFRSGMYGEICVVFLAEDGLAQVLEERRDLDAFLRGRVEDAQRRKG